MSGKQSNTIVRAVSYLILIDGVFAVTHSLQERLPEGAENLLSFFQYDALNHWLSVLFGFILVYAGFSLLRRSQVAWWVAVSVSLASLASHLLFAHHYYYFIAPGLTLLLLLVSRSQFRARLELNSVQHGLKVFVYVLLAALLYGMVGFWMMDSRDFGHQFSLTTAFSQTLREFILFGDPTLIAHTRQAKWFLDSLSLIGFSSLMYVVYNLFKPIAYRFIIQPKGRQLTQKLLRKYSNSTEDFFKVWPADKSYFIADDRSVAIAYKVLNGIAICYGDPVGKPAGVQKHAGHFLDYCSRQGWLPSFVYVSSELISIYRKLGLTVVRVGHDAMIDINRFNSHTVRNKYFRNIKNRFDKSGYQIEISTPPHSRFLMKELRTISNDWLALPGRREWVFFSGFFEAAYLNRTTLVVLRDKHGSAQAFVNQIPVYKRGFTTIDLMRHTKHSPPNSMDYLLLTWLAKLQGAGFKQFSLGFVPFASDHKKTANLVERILRLIYQVPQPFVSFKGLHQFKSKYEPVWQDRFVAYRKELATPLRISLAITRAMKRPTVIDPELGSQNDLGPV